MRRLALLLALSLGLLWSAPAVAQDDEGGGEAPSGGGGGNTPKHTMDKIPPGRKGVGSDKQMIETDGANFMFEPRAYNEHGATKKRQQKVKFTQRRDDYLWHEESAGTVSKRCGNLSLLSASRYGVNDRVTLSTFLVQDVVRPALYCKVLWKVLNKRWFFASRFGVENAYPGMRLCQKHELFGVSPDFEPPMAFELSHEFLATYGFFRDANCSDGSLWLALTGGLAFFGSINFRNCPDLEQLEWHFIANRGETLVGDGFRGHLKVWADWKINPRWSVHGGPFLHFGGFRKHAAFELRAEGEFFINALFSVKAGGFLSCANYERVKSKIGGLPMVDFTWYFGKAKLRGKELFDRSMYRRSRP